MSDTVKVRIENTYVCGRQSEFLREIPAPSGHREEEVEAWWEDEAFAVTGDGHTTDTGQPCAEREDALYEVTVLDAPGFPELVGETREWGL